MPPSAIIFINADLNDITKNKLTSQLLINETINFSEFNARVTADPNYKTIVGLNGLRVLVILPTFQDYTNRELADLVMFYSHGQVNIEYNRFGPPNVSYPLDRVNIYELLRSVGSANVVILPETGYAYCSCKCKICCSCKKLGGIVVDQLADNSGVHSANCDNEAHNTAFINRK